MNNNTTDKFDFLLAGVGGQGAITASNILAGAGLMAGFDVKKAEVHGMSQLGGTVNIHVRWGRERVHSPLIGLGGADYLIAFEKAESLRYAEFLQPGGVAVINDQAIMPVAVTLGDHTYPSDAQMRTLYAKLNSDVHLVPGLQIAQEIGNVRVANTVVLGALSTLLPTPEASWMTAIETQVPKKYIEANQEAFRRGRQTMA